MKPEELNEHLISSEDLERAGRLSKLLIDIRKSLLEAEEILSRLLR